MLKIGVTGGIGSGKTTVCKIFESLGIPVYYADERAKLLMVQNSAIIKQVKLLFGEEAYLPDGSLNRKRIANIAFKDKAKLSGLNSVVHPEVFRDNLIWQEQQKGAPYILKEAAILFESGSYKMMDKNIMVYAPVWERIGRVMKRDQASFDEIMERVRKQMPDTEKIKLSDYIIYNDGSRSLIKQILALHHTFSRL